MKIANKTIAYNVYAKVAGKQKQIGETTDLQLPSVELMTDTLKGAGILGEIDWPSLAQPGSMTFAANFRVTGVDAVAISAPGLQEFEIRWVIDKFDTNNVKVGIEAHKAFIKCVTKKHDGGKLEPASGMDGSNEYEVFYFRRIIDGVEVLLIDKFNYIYKVNGVNYTSAITAAL
jgi:P2 family phage contractile tail tube protein